VQCSPPLAAAGVTSPTSLRGNRLWVGRTTVRRAEARGRGDGEGIKLWQRHSLPRGRNPFPAAQSKSSRTWWYRRVCRARRFDDQQSTDCLHGLLSWILWIGTQPVAGLFDTGKPDAAFGAGVCENRGLPYRERRLSRRRGAAPLLSPKEGCRASPFDGQQSTYCLHGRVSRILRIGAQPRVSLFGTGQPDAELSAGVCENRGLPYREGRLCKEGKVSPLPLA
jgi:hypothetical protein